MRAKQKFKKGTFSRRVFSILMALAMVITLMPMNAMEVKAENATKIQITSMNLNVEWSKIPTLTVGQFAPRFEECPATASGTGVSPNTYYGWAVKALPEHVASGYIDQTDYERYETFDHWMPLNEYENYTINATDTYACFISSMASEGYCFAEKSGVDLKDIVTSNVNVAQILSDNGGSSAVAFLKLGTVSDIEDAKGGATSTKKITSMTLNVDWSKIPTLTVGQSAPRFEEYPATASGTGVGGILCGWAVKALESHVESGYITQEVYDGYEAFDYWVPLSCYEEYTINATDTYACFINSWASEGYCFAERDGVDLKDIVTSNVNVAQILSNEGGLCAVAFLKLGTVSDIEDAKGTVPEGYTTDDNGLMAYRFTSEEASANDGIHYDYVDGIDIMGYVEGEWRGTTCYNIGNTVIIKIDDEIIPVKKIDGSEPIKDGVELYVNVTPSFVSDGQLIKLTYTVENKGSIAVDYSIAGFADAEFNDNDRCPIVNVGEVKNGSAFALNDTVDDKTISFAVFPLSASTSNYHQYWAYENYFVDGINGYWVDYDDERNKLVTEKNLKLEGLNGADSGYSFAWNNQTLGAGESKSYSALFGVGDLENLEDAAEEEAAPKVTITATAGENGSISPSGEVQVTKGENQTFTIAPDIGYEIDTLTVDGKAVTASTSYTFSEVTAAHTIDVTFKQVSSTPDPTPEPTPTPEVHTHTIVTDAAVAPTCTETGKTEGKHCSVCGEVITAQTTVAAKGHDFTGEWTVIKEATATTDGKKETVCKNGCGTKKVLVIAATGASDETEAGNVEKDAEVAASAPVDSATLNNSKQEMIQASGIFTEEERTQISNGAAARIYLSIQNVTDTSVTSEDKTKIENKAKEVLGNDVNMNLMDLTLLKKVGSSVEQKVHNPGIEIEVTIEIPDTMLQSTAGVQRKYRILRLHDGIVDTILGTFNRVTNEFSFKTDRFSTYAIAYSDEQVEVETSAATTTLTTVGQSVQLATVVKPEADADQTVTYVSSNPAVATVDATGKVTAVANGTSVITVTTADGSKSSTITITVNIPETTPSPGQTPSQEVTPSPGQTPSQEVTPSPGQTPSQEVTPSPEVTPEKAAGPQAPKKSKFKVTAPSKKGAKDGKITGVNSKMEYSTDNGKTWKSVKGNSIKGIKAGKVKIRYKETSTNKAGKVVTITVKEGKPASPNKSSIKITKPSIAGEKDAKITGVNSKMEYSTDNGKTWKSVKGNSIKDIKAGKVLIRIKATDKTAASDAVEVTIKDGKAKGPKAPAKSTFKVTTPSTQGGTDGKITGVNSKMEYSLNNGKSWKKVSGNSIKGLKAGKVRIRIKETSKAKAGSSVVITLKDGKYPSQKQIEKNTVDLISKAGATWNKDKKMNLSWGKVKEADGYEIYVRICDGVDIFTQKPIVVDKKTTSVTLDRLSETAFLSCFNYKYAVRAYKMIDGKKVYIGQTLTYHFAAKDNKWLTNPSEVTVDTKAITLKEKKAFTITAKITKAEDKKIILDHEPEIRYVSSNEDVAKVDLETGKVTAVKSGKCKIYCIAINGVSTSVDVTVK